MVWVTSSYTTTSVKLVKTPGWNAGARTIQGFVDDGAFVFAVGQATGIVAGLNSVDRTADYREIKNGFFIESRSYRIIEQGELKTSSRNYFSGSKFKVERVNNVIRYYVDDVWIYTSTQNSGGLVFGDCSLYAYLDSIVDAEILDYSSSSTDGYDSGSAIIQVVAMGQEGGDNIGYVQSRRPVVTGSELARYYGETTTHPVWAFGQEFSSNIGAALTGRVVVEGEELGGLAPDVNYGIAITRPPSGNGYEDRSFAIDVALETRPITAIGTDAMVVIGSVLTQPVEVTGFSPIRNYLVATAPRWTVEIRQYAIDGTGRNASATCQLPALAGTVYAVQESSSAICRLPELKGTSFGGASTECRFLGLIGESLGIGIALAAASCGLPELEGESTALTGIMAIGFVNLPATVGESWSGAVAIGRVSSFSGTVTGLVGSIAQAFYGFPELIGSGFGISLGIGRSLCNIPALFGNAGIGIHIECLFPALEGVAIGRPVIGLSTGTETYIVNLQTKSVTRWLVGRIDKWATAHGKLYGIRNGQLVVFDSAQENILPMTIRFAQQSFGTLKDKRAVAAYLSCRKSSQANLSIIADEMIAYRYQTQSGPTTALHTHRVKFGKGIKFNTLGLIFEYTQEGPFELAGFELLIQLLSRRVRT